MKAILIKWLLDTVIDLVIDILREKVADRKSKVSKTFFDVFVQEQEQLKKEILTKIGK